MTPRLRNLGPRIETLDTARVAVPAKTADPFYRSPRFREWRETVVSRAWRRCEAVDKGGRCTKAEPAHRMFADHIEELKDGGDPFDPANGQCLCGSHHSSKTAHVRADRMRS